MSSVIHVLFQIYAHLYKSYNTIGQTINSNHMIATHGYTYTWSKFERAVLGTVARANAMEIAHRITSDCSTCN